MTAPLTYLTVRGAGEVWNNPNNMLAQVVKAVQRQANVQWVDVDYPASIAIFNPARKVTGTSESSSRRQGVANLAAAIDRAPGKVVVSGYSLGALVVSDFLAEQKRGRYRESYVSAVVNIANPARRERDSYGRTAHGFGLDGQRKDSVTPVYELANPFDLITSAPAMSPWRMFADKIRKFSFQDIDGWLDDMVKQLAKQQVIQGQHHIFEPGWWREHQMAPAWLRGYAIDGQHTFAYGDRDWTDPQTGKAVTAIELAASTVCRYA